MRPAKTLRFERFLQEYKAWRAIPDARRAPAAAWWWETALELRDETETLPDDAAATLDLAAGATYADAAAGLMALIAAQSSLAQPAGFPWRSRSKESTTNDSASLGGADHPA